MGKKRLSKKERESAKNVRFDVIGMTLLSIFILLIHPGNFSIIAEGWFGLYGIMFYVVILATFMLAHFLAAGLISPLIAILSPIGTAIYMFNYSISVDIYKNQIVAVRTYAFILGGIIILGLCIRFGHYLYKKNHKYTRNEIIDLLLICPEKLSIKELYELNQKLDLMLPLRAIKLAGRP